MNIKTFIKIYLKNQLIPYIDVGAADNINPRWKIISEFLDFIGFEPNKKEFKKIHNKNFGKFKMYNFALGNKNQIKQINILRSEFASSFLTPNYDDLKKFTNSQRFEIKKKLNINVKKLDSLQLAKADFIKIDTQGYNIEVLKGSKKILKKIIGVEIETEFFRIYKNQKLFEDTKKFLENKKFEFINFYNLRRWSVSKSYGYGKLIFCNSLFLKKLSKEDLKKKNVIIKYVIICILYNNLDLAFDTINKSSFSIDEKKEMINFISLRNKKNIFVKFYVSIFNRFFRFINKEDELYPTF